jgi:hypothetical protein
VSTGRRVSYVRAGSQYRGALREGARVVWACPHLHSTRDSGHSATQCARVYLAAPDEWQRREDQRVASIEARRAAGWH